jgi:hypothetical protein
MKKLIVLLCLVTTALSACYIVPIRGGGYHEHRHHFDGERSGDRARDH